MKRRFMQASVSLMMLMILLFTCAGAEGKTGGVITEEYSLERDGKKIYGKLYLPENAEFPLPLLILSHGLGSDHTKMDPYAEIFAGNGFAAYVFDYIGGSEKSLSDGSMTEMSVLTEAEDLNCILDQFIDESRNGGRFSEKEIFLFGGSQGGFISTYVAAERPEDTAGLIALYPAYNLQDICRSLVSEDGGIPETTVIGKYTVGSIYVKDIISFDIYEVMKQYTGPALLFQGTADTYVPVDYARKAAETLPDAELIIVEGAGHGFKGEDLDSVAQKTIQFVREILKRALPDAA